MHRMFLITLAGLCALCLFAQQNDRTLRPQQGLTQFGVQEARIALVIGNGGYKDAPLKNPPSDARAMAQALVACGFKVILVVDANRAEMFRAVREFGERIRGGGVGLFYYAGHGMQVRGANYLIPVGVDINSEDEVPVQGLDVNAVLGKMDVAKNRVNLLILDACRNNPFARSFRSANRGLTQMEAPSGSFVAFATAPGSTASDGAGQNGLYTQYILKALQQPGLNVEQVFKLVRIGVKKASRDQQVPWDSSSLTGEFYFLPAREGSIAPVPVTPSTPVIAGSSTRTVGEWMTWQAEMDEAIAQLKITLARKDPDAGGKLTALEETQRNWAENNPYTDRDDQARAWMQDQYTGLLITQSAAVATQAKRSLNTEGFTAWRMGERGKLELFLKGSGKGERYLKWLENGQGNISDMLYKPGDVMKEQSSGIELVRIPSGTFTMGSADGGGDEKPPHAVTLTQAFWMGKFPVTQRQWQEVMGNNPSSFGRVGSDAPVEQVSWDDAQQFLTKLNGMQSQWTFRLPTEAEWEYACRAGTEGVRYGDLNAIAWHEGNSGKTTHIVGQKQPNAFGLYDMNGNVFQWCQDWYGSTYYEVSPSVDPQGPLSPVFPSYRVLRGGAWNFGATRVRSAFRDRRYPDGRYYSFGFRVVAVARIQ